MAVTEVNVCFAQGEEV